MRLLRSHLKGLQGLSGLGVGLDGDEGLGVRAQVSVTKL